MLEPVGPPAISPDGSTVAFTLDYRRIWVADMVSGDARALPWNRGPVEQLDWTPDSKAVTFIARDDHKVRQVWLHPVDGESATALTSYFVDVSEYAVSPLGTSLALVVEEPSRKPKGPSNSCCSGEPMDLTFDGVDLRKALMSFADIGDLGMVIDADVEGEAVARFRGMPWDEAFESLLKSYGLGYTYEYNRVRVARLSTLHAEELQEPDFKPHVIKRLYFKREGKGYLKEEKRSLRVRDIAAGTESTLEGIPDDPAELTWSPDSRVLAFTATGVPHPVGKPANDIFVVDLERGHPRNLTRSSLFEDSPVFTADGRELVYRVDAHPDDWPIVTHRLALVSVDNGETRPLVNDIDREIEWLRMSPDRQHLWYLVPDRGTIALTRVNIADGQTETLETGERVVHCFDVGPGDGVVALLSEANSPRGLFIVDGDQVSPLVQPNLCITSDLDLPKAQRVRTKATDGVEIEAFLIPPVHHLPGAEPPPAVIWLHGGPQSMHAPYFDELSQLLASAGYAVLTPNPRGSSGYGRAFALSIRGAWGTTDYDDVVALVDEAVRRGLIDGERLGVGGWSYGGWLTNHILTRTDRFKAAVSGASIANFLAEYGVSDTALWTERELGLPWTNTDDYIRMSPLFAVENVTTPTLVLCGEDDIRTPTSQSEQWYQALRRVGVTSELVVYPDEGHSFSRVARRDSWERTVAWYDSHLGASREGLPEAASRTSACWEASDLPPLPPE